MPRIRMNIEYDGSRYVGWQYQKNGHSIQGAIEHAFAVVLKQHIKVTASGRTDAGVHARNQVAHADIPQSDLFRLKGSLNGILADDIAIKEIEYGAADFHARYDAKERVYCYYIAQKPTALHRHFVWHVRQRLQPEIMNAGADIIKQYENFQAFCKVGSEVNHYNCTIFSNRWFKERELLVFEIRANRFLHGMVRAIVGLLVSLGEGKTELKALRSIIESRERRRIPLNAPAKGLILENVIY